MVHDREYRVQKPAPVFGALSVTFILEHDERARKLVTKHKLPWWGLTPNFKTDRTVCHSRGNQKRIRMFEIVPN